MTWVRRQADEPAPHLCLLPMATVPVFGFQRARPDGQIGDLWRCDDCRTLWRIGEACDWCDRYGGTPHGGMHAVGTKWRPARLGQILRLWRRR